MPRAETLSSVAVLFRESFRRDTQVGKERKKLTLRALQVNPVIIKFPSSTASDPSVMSNNVYGLIFKDVLRNVAPKDEASKNSIC